MEPELGAPNVGGRASIEHLIPTENNTPPRGLGRDLLHTNISRLRAMECVATDWLEHCC